MSAPPNVSTDILAGVTEIISRIGQIADLPPDQNSCDRGVTSLMALPLLLEIEDRFQIGIPDDRFIAARTPRAVELLVAELHGM